MQEAGQLGGQDRAVLVAWGGQHGWQGRVTGQGAGQGRVPWLGCDDFDFFPSIFLGIGTYSTVTVR